MNNQKTNNQNHDHGLPLIADYFDNKDFLYISFSRLSTFLNCKREFYFKYILGLKSQDTTKSLAIGKIVHDILHEVYKNEGIISAETIDYITGMANNLIFGGSNSFSEQEKNDVVYAAVNLIEGYLKEYNDEKIEIKDSELELYKNYTTSKHNPFTLYGRIDAIGIINNSLWQIEHKTTGRYDNLYLNGLRGSMQNKLYNLLLFEHGYSPMGVIFNLLVNTKKPQYYRQPIMFSYGIVYNVLQTIFGVVDDICRYKKDYHEYYPNYNNCIRYNRPCDFKILCDSKPENFEANKNEFFIYRGD